MSEPACLLCIAKILGGGVLSVKTGCLVTWPLCLLCSSASIRQKLWGRWLSGRWPFGVFVQRRFTVCKKDGEHGFVSTPRLRLQHQICRSESEVSLTSSASCVSTAFQWLTGCLYHTVKHGSEILAWLLGVGWLNCYPVVVCREGWVWCWSCGWGGLHPGFRRCFHSAGLFCFLQIFNMYSMSLLIWTWSAPD